MMKEKPVCDLNDSELEELTDEDCCDYICDKDCGNCRIQQALLEKIKRESQNTKEKP